ncbi:S1 RNA-binding domain-containing protein, partial [Candidatus Kaiserbacteria bacterium]|nr:S1 RNA-binding domain-containing protein [Candidatus Kaiserbacteria bacterium]
IVNATVQRIEGRMVFVDIGRASGILPPPEQVPSERYRIGDRLRVYVLTVEKNPRGPGIVVSRAHPQMIAKLFELAAIFVFEFVGKQARIHRTPQAFDLAFFMIGLHRFRGHFGRVHPKIIPCKYKGLGIYTEALFQISRTTASVYGFMLRRIMYSLIANSSLSPMRSPSCSKYISIAVRDTM